MVQNAREVPRTLQAGIEKADREGKQGYEDDRGRWIDPKPVQLGAIREAFATASNEDDFNVFTVVDPSKVRDDRPFEQNFRQVQRTFAKRSEESAETIVDQLEAEGYDVDRSEVGGQ